MELVSYNSDGYRSVEHAMQHGFSKKRAFNHLLFVIVAILAMHSSVWAIFCYKLVVGD